MKAALTEYQSVKCTVDNISKGSDKDQGHTEDQPPVGTCFSQVAKVPPDEYHGQDAKNAEGQFSISTPKGHSKSHSLILRKMDQEPIPQYRELFPKIHIGFNPNLDKLIDQQYQKNGDDD